MNNTRPPKRPAFLFYTGDWLKAPDLRACSLAARGLWMDALCLMFESAEPGCLRHSTGRPVSTEQIARMTGCAVSEAEQLLQELADAGVLSRADDGAIYCRRMVRDERKRELCSDAGKRGGNPTLKGGPKGDAKGGPKGDAKGGPKGDAKGGPKPNPTPSVSVSVSSNTPLTPHGGNEGAEPEPKRGRRKKADAAEHPLFASFYQAYPRKTAKPDAAKAFAKIDPDETLLARMLSAIAAQRKSDDWTRENGRFIPYPATWLNQRRWEDEPTEMNPPASPRSNADSAATILNNLI